MTSITATTADQTTIEKVDGDTGVNSLVASTSATAEHAIGTKEAAAAPGQAEEHAIKDKEQENNDEDTDGDDGEEDESSIEEDDADVPQFGPKPRGRMVKPVFRGAGQPARKDRPAPDAPPVAPEKPSRYSWRGIFSK